MINKLRDGVAVALLLASAGVAGVEVAESALADPAKQAGWVCTVDEDKASGLDVCFHQAPPATPVPGQPTYVG